MPRTGRLVGQNRVPEGISCPGRASSFTVRGNLAVSAGVLARAGQALPGHQSVRSHLVVLLFAFALPFALGCNQQYITNTDVEETDFNRRVIEFCEKYRRAVERRNISLLLKLAHPRYYEDGGSVDTADDLDYAGLQEYLLGRFKQTSAIRYEVRYRNVTIGSQETVLVDFTYSASYKIPTPDGEVWRRQVADNRLELIREGEEFRIVAGM